MNPIQVEIKEKIIKEGDNYNLIPSDVFQGYSGEVEVVAILEPKFWGTRYGRLLTSYTEQAFEYRDSVASLMDTEEEISFVEDQYNNDHWALLKSANADSKSEPRVCPLSDLVDHI